MVNYLRQIATRDQVQQAREMLENGGVANRGKFDGVFLQQLFGLQCQMAIAKTLGVETDEETEIGFDGGYDLVYNGLKWDVKCVLRNVDVKMRWKVNIPAPQLTDNYAADGYIFASYNKKRGEFQVVGWITKDDFIEKSTRHEIGSMLKRDDDTMLEIKEVALCDMQIKDLNRIRTIKDLRGIGDE